MIKKIALGQIRHFLTTIGGGFVSNGYLSQDEMTQVVGGAMILIGVIWSAMTPEKKEPVYND